MNDSALEKEVFEDSGTDSPDTGITISVSAGDLDENNPPYEILIVADPAETELLNQMQTDIQAISEALTTQNDLLNRQLSENENGFLAVCIVLGLIFGGIFAGLFWLGKGKG